MGRYLYRSGHFPLLEDRQQGIHGCRTNTRKSYINHGERGLYRASGLVTDHDRSQAYWSQIILIHQAFVKIWMMYSISVVEKEDVDMAEWLWR